MPAFRNLFYTSAVTVLLFYFLCNEISAQQSKVVHPEWSENATIYEVNVRQYTEEGTFKAFEESLSKIKSMGVDIIWLMPIHPIGEKNRKGSLGSYYSVKDYKAVNPEFGSIGDFKNLVDKIHGMGMYVIIDWVANHTAWDHKWTETNPDFYSKDSLGNFYAPVPDWHDVIDLNFDNKELRKEMIDALKFWVNECGIDGYRCDVAAMVPTEFWNKARQELDKIKPVFMLAEANEPELHEAAFDMTYNWPLKDVMNAIAIGEKNANSLHSLIQSQKSDYPADSYLMNFTTNHDENTWQGTVFERLGESAETFMVLCSMIEGMPLVYSGQEAGLNKRLDFFEKDPIEWKEHEFYSLIRKLFALKKNNKALWNGSSGGELVRLKTSNDENIFAFIREKEGNKIFAVFNLSPDNINVDIESHLINAVFNEFLTETEVDFSSGFGAELQGWDYKIYFK